MPERARHHTVWGPLSVTDLATLVLGHDAYRLRWIAGGLETGR